MRAIGFFLMTAGFLAGTLVAAQTAENTVEWSYFIPAVVVAIIGIVLSRLGAQREAEATAAEGAGMQALREAIDRVVTNIRQLDQEGETLDPYAVHGRIDELFVEDLNLFADNRQQIATTYGLQPYAEVMNDFAAGERYLNRVWSASVDGYIDEIRAYLSKARTQFEQTRSSLERLEQS
ncbi:MAG: hypothetical protein GTN89_11730 [Acidobacteria bacterium]|nr:hypothetical protein [Acidobacteriota bacterium]NIM60976.1 hypothetical protein [Acidobacteriota bacterium]NIO59944.1 hypothetical protein [Acidobacteriota bacterium]NIQ31016.1 hypothetical protein [Acidobacteriota bacterium]NIQ86144.1 hypothetical protein [Acidobacteriota bacterium]